MMKCCPLGGKSNAFGAGGATSLPTPATFPAGPYIRWTATKKEGPRALQVRLRGEEAGERLRNQRNSREQRSTDFERASGEPLAFAGRGARGVAKSGHRLPGTHAPAPVAGHRSKLGIMPPGKTSLYTGPSTCVA